MRSSSPTAPNPSQPKQYTITATNLSRSKISLKPKSCNGKEYTSDLSFSIKDLRNKRKQHSVVLRSSSDDSIVGISDIDLLSATTPVHLCFGDPDTEQGGVVWEDIYCQSRLKMNIYEFSIDLGPDVGRKVFVWKRTHSDSTSDPRSSSGRVVRKLDFLNLKMEEKGTGTVVARFMHYPWVGWKRGELEIVEMVGEGERWVKICLLSGIAMVEYLRKIGGWSW